ncbi:Phosphate-regulating neutral endopeptidase [Strongyloides ratti]|uniref:Phosphate-regulating neutral endopeptidase n=1 Tax=Strongyloides ratti TaxID=34506 RepID=A0A090N0I4_STRRB|nr:Phosphate-regulating neutral endopeptidase [Strongyloides ratti]CEF70743.1 Phosphate-regulating neutral endopeptidase [Strongyloides ratti]
MKNIVSMKFFIFLINFILIVIWFTREDYIVVEEKLTELIFDPVQTSMSLKKYIDESIDPCDDFYQFSCGKWIQNEKQKEKNSSLSQNVKYNFYDDIYNGKYINKSKTMKKLYILLKKCDQVSGKEQYLCKEIVLLIGRYGITSFIINEIMDKEILKYNYITIENMYEKIKKEFIILVEKEDNIFDTESKKNVIESIKKLKLDKTFRKFVSNVTLMEKCYDYIQFSVEDDIEKILKNITNFFTNKTFDDITYEKECKFIMSISSADHLKLYLGKTAYYTDPLRKIFISPRYIEKPLFSLYYPMSLNYGGLGFTMAHEILHGFDRLGVSDKPEYLQYSNILTNKSKIRYDKANKCLEKQYNSTQEEVTGKYINGLLTLRENIADNNGIKISHQTFMKYLKDIGGEEPKIPGFEKYTPEQLFFINFARSFCSYTSDKNKIEKRLKDDHAPNKNRIIVTLGNYKPFSNAFNCKLGTKMNPIHKCLLG